LQSSTAKIAAPISFNLQGLIRIYQLQLLADCEAIMHHRSLSETIIQSGVAAASQEGGPHYLSVTLPLSILLILEGRDSSITYASKDSWFDAGDDGVGLLKRIVLCIRHQISKPEVNHAWLLKILYIQYSYPLHVTMLLISKPA
jgi:hypothetical protein